MIRRVHSEGVLLLGGGRALLMQIAHPSVAAGVEAHSSYRSRKLDRLLRTLRSTYALIFGTRAQALSAAARVNDLHRGVNGDGYDALDPELLCWVLATLIDTSLQVHERFVRPLTVAERDAYYEDAKRLGPLLGLPAAAIPTDLQAHHRYVDKMAESLSVSECAKAISAELFRPSPGLELPLWFVKQVTAGLLPHSLRRQFGLSWDSRSEAVLRAGALLSRSLLPRLPAHLRAPPVVLMPRRAKIPSCDEKL